MRILGAFSLLLLASVVSCGDGTMDADDTDALSQSAGVSSYNTVAQCAALFHPGDGWKSLCKGHGGWGNPNKTVGNGRACKQVDCERNAEHDVSAYFWPSGCKCKDGYTGPDPNAGLEPLPPGCDAARAGKISFCQKDQTCRGTGTKTLKGFSCRDVNKGFAALVCSGMFSANDWKKMRATCCYN